MPLSEADQGEVTQRYLTRIQALATAGGAVLVSDWDDLGSWDEPDVERLAEQAQPSWEVFAQQAAAVSAAYLALVLDDAPVGAVSLVEPDWLGPFTHYWGALGNGLGPDIALEAGRARAAAAGHKAVTSTARRTGSLFDDRVQGWRRTLSGDSCQWCITVAGQTYRTADSADFGHDRCLVGSTRVSSATPARQVTRRWHAGEVIVIRTAAGHELTITPNHPVLTPRGWVLAGLLNEGGDLVCCSGLDRAPGVVPDEHNVPASIEQRFGAHAVRRLVSVPFASKHFHGDVGDGQVDVVATDGSLDLRFVPAIDEQRLEQPFPGGWPPAPPVDRSRLCRLHQLVLAGRHTPDSGMSGSDLSGPLRRSHPGRPVQCSGTHASNGNVALDEMPPQRVTIDAERPGDRKLALTGDVALDRITELRRISLGCHVFNLVTDQGWYAANSIVVHNCNCGVTPILTAT